jgi:hypothetical protein
MAAGEAGEGFAEVPDSERPGQRGGEREFRGTWDEQSEPDQHLDGRERHVPGDRMRGDDVRRPLDRAGDEVRLPGSERGDHLPGEARSQHERLQLQTGVQEPEQTQRDLQPASSDWGGSRAAYSYVPGDMSP